MVTYYQNYMPIGDVLVLATCLVFWILIHVAYINRTRNFRLFRYMLGILAVTAMADLGFNIEMNRIGEIPNISIYMLRLIYHAGLFADMAFYTLYLFDPLHLSEREKRNSSITVWGAFAVLMLYDVIGTLTRTGFYIDEALTPHAGFNIFPFAYLFFIAVPVAVVLRHRNEIFSRLIAGVVGTVGISILIMFVQGLFDQQSFTAATFLFPLYSLLYLLHSTPYDVEIGAVNRAAFENMIEDNYLNESQMYMMSLYLHEFEVSAKRFPKEIQQVIRHFSSSYFKGAHLYQVSNGRMILAAKVAKNPDYEARAGKMLETFDRVYPEYKLEYKIVGLLTTPEVSEKNDYIGLIQYIENRMGSNEVHFLNDDDFAAYKKHCYIVAQLEDINEKKDLNDPRVLVFCQPVYNTQTGKYDTAEALMRLTLEETGMVFPDQFIPIAEKHHFIHSLSMIILSKTCSQIRRLMDEGYNVERISVNFSMLDVREDDFCRNINRIIESHNIPFDKVAIELTESQNENDFMLVKDKINELKDSGIKFYLDDFGTGYSNFDRIIELPFDIVKFDRSLVIASSTDIKSETMVSYLAHMFSDMNYSVLYEGVEDDSDEDRCLRMCARYLQGYKYSKPIPIDRLTEYFDKSAES